MASRDDFALCLLDAVMAERDGRCAASARPLDERIIRHGIAGLLASDATVMARIPAEIAGPIRAEGLARAMWDMRQRDVLQGLFDAFSAHGCDVLVLKGTALAYSLYRDPAARTRGDADLLIDETRLLEARAALAASGFSLVSRRDFGFQEQWQAGEPGHLVQEIDLHWRTLNAPTLAHLLPYRALLEASEPLAGLHPVARRPGGAHMLIHLACSWAMAGFARYRIGDAWVRGERRLIWLHDIALQWVSLSDGGRAEAEELANLSGIGPVLMAALDHADRVFPLNIDESLKASLRSGAADSTACRYLLGASRLRRGWLDLMATAPLSRRLAYACARLGPDPGIGRPV